MCKLDWFSQIQSHIYMYMHEHTRVQINDSKTKLMNLLSNYIIADTYIATYCSKVRNDIHYWDSTFNSLHSLNWYVSISTYLSHTYVFLGPLTIY